MAANDKKQVKNKRRKLLTATLISNIYKNTSTADEVPFLLCRSS